MWKLLKSALNIGVLLSALVFTPLLALSHFSLGLSSLIADFADQFLSRPSVYALERKARAEVVGQMQAERLRAARHRAGLKRDIAGRRALALDRGKRVLIRGSAAMAVGLVPVLGLSADVYSLAEDYADVCELLKIIDELSTRLDARGESLYRANYCHRPEEGMAALKEVSARVDWPWSGE